MISQQKFSQWLSVEQMIDDNKPPLDPAVSDDPDLWH